MPDVQPPPRQNRTLLNATQEERHDIDQFLSQDNLIHRHLDWIGPLDWIDQRPFLVEKQAHQIQAILMAAPEVPGATWIRLFGVKKSLPTHKVWDRLLAHTTAMLMNMEVSQLAALGLTDWFTNLLHDAGFAQINDIRVLEWKSHPLPAPAMQPDVHIRPMGTEDLPEVVKIDHLAFSPLWQNSIDSLTKAFHQPGISTVATKGGELIGYQISSNLTIHGHLARLAVHPAYQRQKIASALVEDLLQQFTRLGIWHVTVNTQADNTPSLGIYRKFGFQTSQEDFPVYQHNL